MNICALFLIQNIFATYIPIVIAKQEEQKQIQEMVLNILAKKKANPQADTTVEENAIDKLVYQLYGLTEQEIQIVEGK